MASKILVTGGAGYIGSHTLVKLLEEGYDLVILDNLSNSKYEILERVKSITKKNFDFIKGDLSNRKILRKIFNNYFIRSVIHFAGLKAVGESENFPMKYYENNVTGSLSLFQEMALAEVKTIIFSSSATIYGEHSYSRYDEKTPAKPINVYGKTKYIIENILKDIKKSDDNWNIALLRYFNPVGAHSSGMIGENPLGIPNNLFPYIAQVASGLKEKLFVFGDDYPTPDGTCKRDYIHVEDIASAHIDTMNYLLKNKNSLLTLNLGTGKSTSVFEIIKAFEKASGKKVPFEITSRRSGDIAECYANPNKAKRILNWKAKFDINKMCEDTWRWQRNNLIDFS